MKALSPKFHDLISLLMAGRVSEVKIEVAKARAELLAQVELLRKKVEDAEQQLEELSLFTANNPGVMPAHKASAETSSARAAARRAPLRGPTSLKHRPSTNGAQSGASGRTKLSAAEKKKRRVQIVALAREVAEAHNGQLMIADMFKAVEQRGVKMGVGPAKYGTVIGGIVSKTADFKPLMQGVYKYVGPQMNLTH